MKTYPEYPPRLVKLLKKYAHLIDEVTDLRCADNGIWIFLADNYDLSARGCKDGRISIIHEGYETITNRHISAIDVHLSRAHDKWLESASAHELAIYLHEKE